MWSLALIINHDYIRKWSDKAQKVVAEMCIYWLFLERVSNGHFVYCVRENEFELELLFVKYSISERKKCNFRTLLRGTSLVFFFAVKISHQVVLKNQERYSLCQTI